MGTARPSPPRPTSWSRRARTTRRSCWAGMTPSENPAYTLAAEVPVAGAPELVGEGVHTRSQMGAPEDPPAARAGRRLQDQHEQRGHHRVRHRVAPPAEIRAQLSATAVPLFDAGGSRPPLLMVRRAGI